jgi:hypothetical protein
MSASGSPARLILGLDRGQLCVASLKFVCVLFVGHSGDDGTTPKADSS